MNAPRGETEIDIDGVSYRLCLTLGGLAELEAAFACASLSELVARLKRLSALEMRCVLRILLAENLEEERLSAVPPGVAARAIGEAFRAALG